MKLWQKIFLVTLSFVMLAVSFTALYVSQNYFSLTIGREKENAQVRHEYISTGISNKITFERLRADEPLLSEEQVEKFIGEALREQSGIENGIAVYSEKGEVDSARASSIKACEDFVSTVQTEDKALSKLVDYSGKEYFLIGSLLTLEDKSYYLYTSEDFSQIYDTKETAFSFIKFTSIIFAAVSSAALFFIVLHIMRPLEKVNKSISKIADGSYDTRIEEKGGVEIKRLAENVNKMARSIEDSVNELTDIAESRKRFIDNLAHEMKTPLTSIICMSDLLRIKKDISDDERIEFAGIIVEEAKRLKGLSGKLMELIVAGNAELDFRPVRLCELLSDIDAAASPVFEKSGIKLTVKPVDAVINADRELFSSLIFNLLDNARKASNSGGSVELLCKKGVASLTIAVADHGIGMSNSEVKKATEPFYMADKSRSRKAGGAGLGLALCAEIAKRHGAVIKLSSAPRKGTTVFITIRTGGEAFEA